VEENLPLYQQIFAWSRTSSHILRPGFRTALQQCNLVEELPSSEHNPCAMNARTSGLDRTPRALKVRVRYGDRWVTIRLDCGAELPYSWNRKRIEGTEPAVIRSPVRWFGSWFESVRTGFRNGVIRRSVQRLVIGASAPWPDPMMIGPHLVVS